MSAHESKSRIRQSTRSPATRAHASSRARDEARDATDAPVLVDIVVVFFAVLNLRHDGSVRRRARVWRREAIEECRARPQLSRFKNGGGSRMLTREASLHGADAKVTWRGRR